MIARMSKYDLVLYAGQSSDFIEKLRGLGPVSYTHLTLPTNSRV